MKLSVIIPTHERWETLKLTLDAIEKQDLSREKFEAIVVDDGSSEETRKYIRKYDPPYDFKLIEKEQGGLASARNRGTLSANGDILYFLDDDVVPGEKTFNEHLMVHQVEEPPVVVVGSLPYPKTLKMNSFLWYMEKGSHYDLFKNPKKYPGGKPPLPPLNGNSSVSKEIFFQVGKYDENFKGYGGEDLEMGHRLQKAGARFIYNPKAVGYHYHVKDFNQFCKDMEQAGESLIQVFEKYPEIKVSKKIDVLTDPYNILSWDKKIMKFVMDITMKFPRVLLLPRMFIEFLGPIYSLRYLVFPCYRWVAYHAYATGMKKRLEKLEIQT